MGDQIADDQMNEPAGYRAMRMVLSEGVSQAEAARRTGITREAVRVMLQRFGHNNMGMSEAGRKSVGRAASATWTPERKAYAAKLIRERADQHRAYMGIDVGQILHLYHERHWTFRMIADHLGMSRSQVAGYVHRNRNAKAKQTTHE